MAVLDYIEFVGSVEIDRVDRELVVRIYGPEFNAEGNDFVCRISASPLCMEGDCVFGVDEHQAWELAVRWVNMRAAGQRIRDGSGVVVERLPFPDRFPE